MTFLDLVGDDFSAGSSTAMPDPDPLDNCSESSHGIYPLIDVFLNRSVLSCVNSIGTHVAGIIAANSTGITSLNFASYMPFLGVAPQVTLGACKIL